MADINAKAYLDLFTGLWSTQWQVLGGNVAFAGTFQSVDRMSQLLRRFPVEGWEQA